MAGRLGSRLEVKEGTNNEINNSGIIAILFSPLIMVWQMSKGRDNDITGLFSNGKDRWRSDFESQLRRAKMDPKKAAELREAKRRVENMDKEEVTSERKNLKKLEHIKVDGNKRRNNTGDGGGMSNRAGHGQPTQSQDHKGIGD